MVKGDEVFQCVSARKKDEERTNGFCHALSLKAYFEGMHTVATEKL